MVIALRAGPLFFVSSACLSGYAGRDRPSMKPLALIPRALVSFAATLIVLGGCIDAEVPRAKAPDKVDPALSPGACYASFQPGVDPAGDLQRLAAACASPLGLRAVTPVWRGEAQTEESEAERLTFLGRAGRCYRVLSVGEPSVADLDVAVLDGGGDIAAADVSDDRFPVVPTGGLLCLHKDERFTIQAAVVRGRGSYLMQVWGNSSE